MKRLPLLIAAGTLLAACAAPAMATVNVHLGFYASPAYYPYGPRYYPYAPRYYYPRYYYPRYYAYPPLFARPAYVLPPPAPPPMYERYAQVPPPPPKREAAPAPRPAPAPPPPVERLERVTLSATELFAFDEATLRMPQPKLDEIARAMIDNPRIANVTVTGYTDRLGTEAYNLKLSQRRAEVVKGYLVTKGVAASRLTAVGKGEANPVVQCQDKDRASLIRCLEPNRRVEVEQITVERKK
jgi:OOP family OmpA-OmpF porin